MRSAGCRESLDGESKFQAVLAIALLDSVMAILTALIGSCHLPASGWGCGLAAAHLLGTPRNSTTKFQVVGQLSGPCSFL